MLVLFGYLSGLLTVIDISVYIRHIFLRKTKPHRGTFLIWSILGSIAFFSQFAKGASNSLWLPGIGTIGTLFIFFLSFRYGTGGFSKLDRIGLFIAGVSLIAWYFTKEAAVALYITIFIDAVGSYLTMHKAYHMPGSEAPTAWIISAISGLFALFAVGKFDIVLLSYPFYIIIANAAVVGAIELGKQRKA